MTDPNERRAITGVAVRWAHLILALAIYLLTIGAIYATLRAQGEQNSRDIEEMKRDRVTKDRFDEMREDIQRRLQRIEDKLDRDRALRQIH